MNELTENLNSAHRKKEFSCGKEMLDNYYYNLGHDFYTKILKIYDNFLK